MRQFSKERGFSLIEILMVVAIIGILSSQVYASLNESRPRARDSERMSNLLEIQKALGLYYDSNGAFPISVATTSIDGTDPLSLALNGSGYISRTPQDPLEPTFSYEYRSDANGGDFVLGFCLETVAIPNYSPGCNNIISP